MFIISSMFLTQQTPAEHQKYDVRADVRGGIWTTDREISKHVFVALVAMPKRNNWMQQATFRRSVAYIFSSKPKQGQKSIIDDNTRLLNCFLLKSFRSYAYSLLLLTITTSDR